MDQRESLLVGGGEPYDVEDELMSPEPEKISRFRSETIRAVRALADADGDIAAGSAEEGRRGGTVLGLWALGVGAVISGDFFGWNYGLSAGFGGLATATAIAAAMYVAIALSLAELSAAMPTAEGAFAFSRAALGVWGGFCAGLAESLEYVLVPPVVAVGMGGYASALCGTDDAYAPLWWLLFYVLFLVVNIAGSGASLRASVVIVILSLLVLLAMYIGSIVVLAGGVDIGATLHSIQPVPPHGTPLFPRGAAGVLGAMPFAMWFFLAIEELPVAAEDARHPARDIPRALLAGIATLVVLAFLTLVLNTALPPGAVALQHDPEPLFAAFRIILGTDTAAARALPLLALVGMAASFHAIMFAYGRQLWSLARAGALPGFLARARAKTRAPWAALVVGGGVGYAAALVAFYADTEGTALAMLLNMAVLCTLISYALSMISFIMLRVRRPELRRPFRSPLGVGGALFALLTTLATFVYLLVEPDYLAGVWATLGGYALGLLYFAVRGRRELLANEHADTQLMEEPRAEAEYVSFPST